LQKLPEPEHEAFRKEIPQTVRVTMPAKESAKYLGLSYWKFLEDIKAGRIPHFRIGNRVLCRKISLDVWMAAKETASVCKEDEQSYFGKIRQLR